MVEIIIKGIIMRKAAGPLTVVAKGLTISGKVGLKLVTCIIKEESIYPMTGIIADRSN